MEKAAEARFWDRYIRLTRREEVPEKAFALVRAARGSNTFRRTRISHLLSRSLDVRTHHVAPVAAAKSCGWQPPRVAVLQLLLTGPRLD